jgi:hypothetical protein
MGHLSEPPFHLILSFVFCELVISICLLRKLFKLSREPDKASVEMKTIELQGRSPIIDNNEVIHRLFGVAAQQR